MIINVLKPALTLARLLINLASLYYRATHVVGIEPVFEAKAVAA
jgi:hypothetical protein